MFISGSTLADGQYYHSFLLLSNLLVEVPSLTILLLGPPPPPQLLSPVVVAVPLFSSVILAVSVRPIVRSLPSSCSPLPHSGLRLRQTYLEYFLLKIGHV